MISASADEASKRDIRSLPRLFALAGLAPAQTALLSPRQRCCVVRRERHHARPIRAITPGVVGATLYDGVAGREVNLLRVEHEGDLAVEHQAEIECTRSLHVRMERLRGVGRGAGRSHRGEVGRDLIRTYLVPIPRI